MANSLHEVMFDFQNNLTTWVNHREMGKLVPECYFHFGGQDSGKNDNQHIQEILFERGFIPNAPDRSNEELTQVANYLSQELVIACKNDMSNISAKLIKWRNDNISSERGIADAIKEASQNKQNPDKEKSYSSILKRSIYDKVILEKSDRPANTANDIKKDEDDINNKFDFIDNIIKAEGIDSNKAQFTTDEA